MILAKSSKLYRIHQRISKVDGCPEGEDLLVWFRKLVEAERKSDSEEADDGKRN